MRCLRGRRLRCSLVAGGVGLRRRAVLWAGTVVEVEIEVEV